MKMRSVRGGNRGMISSIKSAVWMIGMGYLFWTGNWFPGILYLVGISILLEVVLKLVFASTIKDGEFNAEEFDAPRREEELDLDENVLTPDPIPSPNNTRMQRLDPVASPQPLSREYRTDLLPPNCPNCGAPISVKDVEMVGIKTAKCSFCGSNFSLSE